MKKIFKLRDPKKQPARILDRAKFDVKKYIKRERNKKIEEGFFWVFDCKYGATAEEAEIIVIADINKKMDEALAKKLETFYLEILAKKEAKPVREKETEGVVEEEYEGFDED